jgi:hypothetical protein
MARVCYVILAHEEPLNLLGLVGSLWNRQDHFSIWIDGKSPSQFTQFAASLGQVEPNITVGTGPVVNWGGFSIVSEALDAYNAVLKDQDDFSHVVLCSGTHIPLRHPEGIHSHIQLMPAWIDISRLELGEEGIARRDALPPGWPRDILTRFRYHYIELDGVGMLPAGPRASWPERFVLEGSQWHVLRRDVLEFVLNQEADLRARFHDVLVPDEHTFQWAVSKPPFSNSLKRGDHVFMEWDGASPRRLGFPEASQVDANQYLFARKASPANVLSDWVGWARDKLGNFQGASRLENWTSIAQLAEESAASSRTDEEGNIKPLLATLLTAMSLSNDNVRNPAPNRYLIDCGETASAAHLFLLGFWNSSTGLSVVPAMRAGDVEPDIRARPSVPFFSEFRNIAIDTRVGWVIGPPTLADRCNEVIEDIIREVAQLRTRRLS